LRAEVGRHPGEGRSNHAHFFGRQVVEDVRPDLGQYGWVHRGQPVITKVAPNYGAVAGGTVGQLKGSGLVEAASVHFGTAPASSFTINSASSITAVAPAGTAGTVDVMVTSATGTTPASSADHFLYRV
jgi:hypothetical protein